MNADVVYGGRAAHSARPWEGENAIDNAAAALAALRGRAPERPSRSTASPTTTS